MIAPAHSYSIDRYWLRSALINRLRRVYDAMIVKSYKTLLCYRLLPMTVKRYENKAGYTATPVACGWAGAVLEKVTRAKTPKK